MSSTTYVILGYVSGLALLWGYALSLWLTSRGLDRRESPSPQRQASVGDKS